MYYFLCRVGSYLNQNPLLLFISGEIMMDSGDIEIQKWQEDNYFCARIVFRLDNLHLMEERFISAKTKLDFNREIERVLKTGMDLVLH